MSQYWFVNIFFVTSKHQNLSISWSPLCSSSSPLEGWFPEILFTRFLFCVFYWLKVNMNSMKLVIPLHWLYWVNSNQRWKQTRFSVCFHPWCELTSTMNVTEWQVSWNSWIPFWGWIYGFLMLYAAADRKKSNNQWPEIFLAQFE